MSRRPLVLLASAALAAALFAACGGDDTSTTMKTVGSVTPDASAATAKPSPTADAKQPTTTGSAVPGSKGQTPGAKEPYVLTNPTTTPSGLKYQDEVVGTGASPVSGKRVAVHYTGKLVDGTKFDSSVDRGQPFVFQIGVGQVIKGWDEGVMSMKVGGKRLLFIPAALGYGSRGAGALIPPNADLVFEVELLDVER